MKLHIESIEGAFYLAIDCFEMNEHKLVRNKNKSQFLSIVWMKFKHTF